MPSAVHAACLIGVCAEPVQVEVQLSKGLPGFDVVGLPERGVRESRVRVKAALAAEGYSLPPRHLVLNLAPGDLRKSGAGFDLAIAIAILTTCGQVGDRYLGDTLLVGELSLAGVLRPVRGVLPLLRRARSRGLRRAIVPAANAAEATLLSDLDVRVAGTLGEVVRFLNDQATLPRPESGPFARAATSFDLADVRGQAAAKRALEIAATGGHHLLFLGPPGGGKSMLARRLPTILPTPTIDDVLEIATIASAGGFAGPPLGTRPFRAPHYTASAAALVGGGDPILPGEVTLAHGGVLFLDEFPEFRRDVIETLRTTMEDGRVVIARARARVEMPAAPLIVTAMNPCPCGFEGDPERLCRCGPERVERYRGRVSGPLLDRFDLQVVVPRVRAAELRRERVGETSADVRARVERARDVLVAAGPAKTLEDLLGICERRAIVLLERATDELALSARGFSKAIRVARTIAALDGRTGVCVADVAEAVQMRALDRKKASESSAIAPPRPRATQPAPPANEVSSPPNEEETCP